MKTEIFNITGMSCAACQAAITRGIKKLDGVSDVEVSLISSRMKVIYDEEKTTDRDIIDAVTSLGYGASLRHEEKGSPREESRASENAELAMRAMKRRLISSIIILIPLMYLAMGHMLSLPLPPFLAGEKNVLASAFTQLLMTAAVVLINKKFYVSGFAALRHRAPNMDSLVAVGSGASLIYGIFSIYRMIYGLSYGMPEIVSHYSHMLYFESCAMILTLVTVGKYLESRSKAKTTGSVEKLIALAPKTAAVIRDGEEVEIQVTDIAVGDIVVIRPGDRIPVDGIVTEGSGYIDQSAITGESIPVRRAEGDTVISATANKNGSFRFRATRVGADTTLSQIINLTIAAGDSKAPIARLADKVSEFFVPAVMGIALATAVIWLLLGKDFEFALNCAAAVLVISCPCALGLATPVAITVGTGKAAELGILIKSAEALETLHGVDAVVLDKTGTVTSGHPRVTDVVCFGDIGEKMLLSVAASAESASAHPLAEAIIERAKEDGAEIIAPEHFELVEGRGIRADVNGIKTFAGNIAFMKESASDADKHDAEKFAERLSAEGKTPIFIAQDGKLCGVIAIADTVRETTRGAIEAFRAMGLETVMLTGDNAIVAEAVRHEVGIDRVIAEVFPADKERHICELQSGGKKVLMIGDGINDAPALTRADVGMAIGAGTDIAIDSADIVLIKSSLSDAVTAIKLSRAVMRNIKMNLFWAFFYNILGIPIAAGALYPAFGLLLSPMLGSAAMSLSSVCVVSNALRLRFFGKKRVRRKDSTDESEACSSEIETGGIDCTAPSRSEEKKENNQRRNTKMKRIINIEGMMCGHCQAHVKKALEAINGVSAVEVELDNKRAIVECGEEVTEDMLCGAVREAGYTVTGYCEE